jgi:hypothetical protein
MDRQFWASYLVAIAVGTLAFLVQKKLGARPGFQWFNRRVQSNLTHRPLGITWGAMLAFSLALVAFLAARALLG